MVSAADENAADTALPAQTQPSAAANAPAVHAEEPEDLLITPPSNTASATPSTCTPQNERERPAARVQTGDTIEELAEDAADEEEEVELSGQFDMVEMRDALERNLLTTASVDGKHHLQHAWTLWFDSPKTKTSSSWHDNVKKVYTFRTVEDFWGVYNNITAASKLGVSSNYHLFKDGVRPEWEDPVNRAGGKWVAECDPAQHADIDDKWLFLMLACIGESFEFNGQISGCVLSVRKNVDRLSVWTTDCRDAVACMSIGAHMKQTVNADRLNYQSHADAVSSDSSYRNKKIYTLPAKH